MEHYFLPINWYIEPPIDFEHKQYILLAYLNIVDDNFIKKRLSPHFLHLNKMRNELNEFLNSYTCIYNKLNKNKYIYFNDDFKIIDIENTHILEIKEIAEFSIPQLTSRLEIGKIILNKNNQLLY